MFKFKIRKLNIISSAIMLSPLALFWFHFISLDDFSLWFDELATWYISLNSNSITDDRSNQPLFFYLIHFLMEATGSESEKTLRLLPAIFGSFIPVVSYFFARQLFNKNIAFITWCTLISSPLIIYLSRSARVYSLLLLAAISAPFMLLNIIKYRKNKKQTTFYIFYILGIISVQALAYCHFFGLCFALLLLFLFFLIERKTEAKNPKSYFVFINLLLLLPSLYRLILSLSTMSDFWIPPVNDFLKAINALISYYLFHDLNYYRTTKKTLLLCTILVYLCSLAHIVKNNKFRPQILSIWLWLIIPIISTLIFSKIKFSLFLNRYLIISYFPFLMISIVGLSFILDKIKFFRSSTLYFTFGIIIVLAQFSFYNFYKEKVHLWQHREAWRESLDHIRPFVKEENSLLICQHLGGNILKYYLRNMQFMKVFNICSEKDALKKVPAILKSKKIIVYKNHDRRKNTWPLYLRKKLKLEHYKQIRSAKIWVFKGLSD